jgi:hypothetical protein
MTLILKDKNDEELELVSVNKLKLKRGGNDYLETLPWYSDGKDWFVEKKLIKNYIKGA